MLERDAVSEDYFNWAIIEVDIPVWLLDKGDVNKTVDRITTEFGVKLFHKHCKKCDVRDGKKICAESGCVGCSVFKHVETVARKLYANYAG